MIPTVGRIVYFKGNKDGQVKNYPAMVTDVNHVAGAEASEGVEAVPETLSLLLNVFTEAGVQTLWVSKQGEDFGDWDWMPFQKDQQARYAADEAKKEAGE